MARFKVTFLTNQNKPSIEVVADDVVGISDYTVQFVDTDGRTLRVLGGIAEVERLSEQHLATIDTSGQSAAVPKGGELIARDLGNWPCQPAAPSTNVP